MEYVSLFETELGIGAVVASERGICRVMFPQAGGGRIIEQDGLSGKVASPLTEQAASSRCCCQWEAGRLHRPWWSGCKKNIIIDGRC